jgi:hypothetical protein
LTVEVEQRLIRFFRSKGGRAMHIAGGLIAYFVLFASKFVILEVVDHVFGDNVDLGGFVEIVAIALTLLAAELAFRRVYNWLADH